MTELYCKRNDHIIKDFEFTLIVLPEIYKLKGGLDDLIYVSSVRNS